MRRRYDCSHRPRDQHQSKTDPPNPRRCPSHLAGETGSVEGAHIQQKARQKEQENDASQLGEKENKPPLAGSPRPELPPDVNEEQAISAQTQVSSFPAAVRGFSQK